MKERTRARQVLRSQQRSAPANEHHLHGEIVRESIDEKARTVEVSFSSQEPVQDFPFEPPLVLLHEDGAVDLDPIRNVGAVLMGHDPDKIVGPIRSIRVDTKDRKGRAVIGFDEDEIGTRALEKVRSGSLKGVSARFRVGSAVTVERDTQFTSEGGQVFRAEDDRGMVVATRWTPREISLTPIAADSSVGVGRTDGGQKETSPMFSEATLERLRRAGLNAEWFRSEDAAIAACEEVERGRQDSDPPPADPAPAGDPEPEGDGDGDGDPPAAPAGAAQGDGGEPAPRAAGDATDRRAVELAGIARDAGLADRLGTWIENGTTPEQARTECIRHLAGDNPAPYQGGRVEVQRDGVDRVRAVAIGAMCKRHNLEWDDKPEDFNEEVPISISYADLARAVLTARGHRLPSLISKRTLIERAISHVTDDFKFVLENIRNKSMQQGFDEVDTTYQILSSAGSMDDFKEGSRPALGELQDFEMIHDGQELPMGTFVDTGEKVKLETYARGFSIGRQALINDDQSAFGRQTRGFGQAAARTLNGLFWAHVTQGTGNNGPIMTEGGGTQQLFSTGHGSGSNLIDGAGGVLGDDSLAEARRLLRLQKLLTAAQRPGDATPSTAFANISGRYLVVPAQLEDLANRIVVGRYDPATASTAQVPENRRLQVVVEPRLDAISVAAWYYWGDPNQYPVVEVARLAGQSAPEVSEMVVTDALGMKWGAYFDADVQALNHRPVVRSLGAA